MGGLVESPEGQRVLSWSRDGTARVWDAASGTELARQTHEGRVSGAVFAADGQRVLSWGEDDTARVWDVGWSVPRSSNGALIAEVCERKLRGTETLLNTPFINGSGEKITHASIRRITAADAAYAPILRDRIGEDVCGAPALIAPVINQLVRLLEAFWK